MTEPRVCRVVRVPGLTPYAEGLRLQQEATAHLQGTGEETLLLLEHAPVITFGRRMNEENVLLSREALAAKGVELFETNRGGDVTWHGPGQLVGYPILDLNPDRRDLRRYMRDLEETLIRCCAAHGVATERVDGLTGVWTARKPTEKIAALGVHVSRWITSHGFAFNVTTQLDAFSLIVPCGIRDKGVTSLAKETGRAVSLDDVARAYLPAFAEVFGRTRTGWS